MKKKEILILLDTNDSYDRNLLRGIINYSTQISSWLLVREPPIYRNIKSGGDKTAIHSENLAGVIASEYKFTDDIRKLSIPIIVSPYKEIVPEFSNILTDDKAIGKMGADYLLAKGFENFAFYGYDDSFWSKRRLESFKIAISESGFNFFYKSKPVQSSIKSFQSDLNRLAKWVHSLPKPIAMLLCCDDLAPELFEALRLKNLKVPNDVSVLGVDNDDLICETCNPPLSSIQHDPFSVGYNAAMLLDEMIKGKIKGIKNIIGEPYFVVSRQSTDILAIKDEDLKKALNFINKYAPNKNISVNDVVYVTNKSRRQLERKFLDFRLLSIGKEIRKVKINHIKFLLLSTDHNTYEIALETGFDNSDNFSRYFSQVVSQSPTEFRKKNHLDLEVGLSRLLGKNNRRS